MPAGLSVTGNRPGRNSSGAPANVFPPVSGVDLVQVYGTETESLSTWNACSVVIDEPLIALGSFQINCLYAKSWLPS